MANTEPLKREVESYVRGALAERFGVQFEKRRLTLARVRRPCGDHEFDAVSKDDAIVAGVITSGPRTSGGKRNSGAVHHATGELYYLTLVRAKRRILISTDPGFHKLMRSVTRGRLAEGVELMHIALPPELEAVVRRYRRVASQEAKPNS